MSQMSAKRWEPLSRHPRILYWFWTPEILEGEKYLRDLERISRESCFTMAVLSARDGMDFYDPALLPHFEKAAATAHELGLQIVLQLWPEGFFSRAEVPLDEAVALVSEAEGPICDGKASLFCKAVNVRSPETAPLLKSVPLKVCAFFKTGDGRYMPEKIRDVTAQAACAEKDGGLEISVSLPEAEGWTVYAMAAHYHAYGDLYGEFFPRSFGQVMERCKAVPFDGFVLDEFKNLALNPWDSFVRERFYGKASAAAFLAQTGKDLKETLFSMRYVPEGEEQARIQAINTYFEWMRQGPPRIERLFAEKAREICGAEGFMGLHNTFHNDLQGDEMYATGCGWWEVSRRYAQTDEDICLPVRMGIACQCPEAVHYDMYYSGEADRFFRKAIEDARFGGRIHYHAMNDRYWGVDVGSGEFLAEMNRIERKVELLNWFDGPLPRFDLLIVFGMPALCNWYPDIEARNRFDLNGKLDILGRADRLWKAGCRAALAPSDAIDDGRITAAENGLRYGGHFFPALLYLYPQYLKPETMTFLSEQIKAGKNLRFIGGAGRDFSGTPLPIGFRKGLAAAALLEAEDPIAEMGLGTDPSDGCTLEDGSRVFSSFASMETGAPVRFRFESGNNRYEGEYLGCAAIRCNQKGELERFACGGFSALYKNGEICLSVPERADVYWQRGEGIKWF